MQYMSSCVHFQKKMLVYPISTSFFHTKIILNNLNKLKDVDKCFKRYLIDIFKLILANFVIHCFVIINLMALFQNLIALFVVLYNF